MSTEKEQLDTTLRIRTERGFISVEDMTGKELKAALREACAQLKMLYRAQQRDYQLFHAMLGGAVSG